MKLTSTLLKFTCFIFCAATVISCSNKTEELVVEPITDYTPLRLVPGKYITYRVDSLAYINFGRTEVTRKYQVRHTVDAQVTDNLGRPSYRIYRTIRNEAGTDSWQTNGSYFITPLADQVEVIDDNMRFIKLHSPIKNGFNWKGNKFLANDPYSSLYNFSNDDAMEDWDYFIEGDKTSEQIGTQTIPDIFTILHADEAINAPVIVATAYGAKTFSLEKYAKGIGMVAREHTLWEYQPNPSGQGGPYKTGFGIKMWMIDHN